VIDVSGSMAGSRIAAAIQGMKKIFDIHELNDRIALKVFDDEVVDIVGLKQKKFIDWSRLERDTKAKAEVGRRTALYDAISKAIETTNRQPVIETKGRVIPCRREIVVFTDGEDTVSKISLFQLKKIMKTMTPSDNYRREKLNITLIASGVESSYSRVLQDLCSGENCHYLSCHAAADAIKASFQQVQTLIKFRITENRVIEGELSCEEFNSLQLETGDLSQFVNSRNGQRIFTTSEDIVLVSFDELQ